MECKYCEKVNSKEELIQCATCKGYCHPSCLELPQHIIPAVKTYDWQCNDCKYCYACHNIQEEQKILFCDVCDRGYHMFCLTPPLKRKPRGQWYCPFCEPLRPRLDSSSSEMSFEINEEEEEPKEIPKGMKGKCTFPGCDGSGNIKKTRLFHLRESRCPLAKKEKEKTEKNKPVKVFSEKCTFPGCDGTGNTNKCRINHVSITKCPLAQMQRRKKRMAGTDAADDDEAPLAAISNKSQTPNKKRKVEETSEKGKEPSSQTPIEKIVSKSDRERYEAATKKAEEVTALDRENAPSSDDIKSVIFGKVQIEAWYKSQYPLEYAKCYEIFVCEFCLEYMKKEEIYKRHMAKCSFRYPPGDEIYRKDNLSVFEVDGQKATPYCQNLCLLAKLFLDHKTLWNDVAPFLFYILTKHDEHGCHMVGYFSKEKVSFLNYNVSCILVLPHHMKKGYGKMLIDFSYLLSQQESKIGSPERPLSDLGLISYRKYWGDKLLQYLVQYDEDQISIKGISEKMSIHPNDVISTLQYLGMLKYWKGKHIILLKQEVLEEYAAKTYDNGEKEIDASCLKWTPPTAAK